MAIPKSILACAPSGWLLRDHSVPLAQGERERGWDGRVTLLTLKHRKPSSGLKKNFSTESSEHVSAWEQMSLLRLTSAGLGFLSRFVLKMWSGLAVGNLM